MKKFGSAIILAGGKSSRMGFDKQFIKFNEIKLMDKIIAKLKVEFDEIIIVTNKPELYGDSPYIITRDIIVGKGPLGGIHAGLKLSSSKYSYVTACDMPNINMEYIFFLKDRVLNSKCYVTKYQNTVEPFNGFYSVELITHIENYLNENKKSIKGLLEEIDSSYIAEAEARKYSPNWDMFSNLNTLKDIENLLNNEVDD